MEDRIRIRRADGTWVVRAGGAVLGESSKALELTEGDSSPVIYFPRGDVAMAFLEKSGKTTTLPQIGEASFYSIVTKSTMLRDSVWSYEDPKPDASRIKGHLAFHAGDKVTVERL